MSAPPFNPPPLPTDLFYTISTNVFDGTVRPLLDSLGLRAYTIYFVTEKFAGPGRGEGVLTGYGYEKIVPSPFVYTISAPLIASSGGMLQDGAVELREISLLYTREYLRGKGLQGDAMQPGWRFCYGLLAKGQLLMSLYEVASEPTLTPLEWRIKLNPRGGNPIPGPGPT